eukprot:CAMPEP_0174232220 /NCGR_PEP_ID=MMETSP0417-20130205/2563_1 /TAXON_ID=242541 /ORGANISM="Mayorella sp, Strain BSH-02190019" /LENGTH=411 /DNA_ID=CAMNT_0015310231 /DNA_START=87 /DNA_END=1319 /DNA_ORIENTATION=+
MQALSSSIGRPSGLTLLITRRLRLLLLALATCLLVATSLPSRALALSPPLAPPPEPLSFTTVQLLHSLLSESSSSSSSSSSPPSAAAAAASSPPSATSSSSRSSSDSSSSTSSSTSSSCSSASASSSACSSSSSAAVHLRDSSRWPTTVVSVPAYVPSSSSAAPSILRHTLNLTDLVPAQHHSLIGYLGVLQGSPKDHFFYALPLDGCGHTQNTSQTAHENHCVYATNAGLFDVATGGCLGNVILNSTVIQTSSSIRANFGLRRQGTHTKIVTGYVNTTDAMDGSFQQLVAGAGWLVKDGFSFINTSAKIEALGTTFVTEKAPRTAVGHLADGRVFLLEVDGVEDLSNGLDLYQMADLLIAVGARNAIGLDGGGSSTTVYRDRVINFPTCDDTGTRCERPVTTIACLIRAH